MIRWASSILVLLALALLAARPQAFAADKAKVEAEQLLDAAKAEAARGCLQPSDVLVRIVCRRELRVGLRTYYPDFSVRDPRGGFAGFEVDIARRIAAFLGVSMVPVAVDPRTRIPQVAGGAVDLVIATMGHNVQRDAEVTFIRPHYYESRTVVVGAKDQKVIGWDDLAARTVCLPVGSSSNILFIRHHIRILTFDAPEHLIDALAFNECAFIVHDDTFFASFLADPNWSARYDVKFGFAPLPWGMAVARSGAEKLAALLDSLSIAFHADGTFLRLASDNHLDLVFLTEQQRRWSSSDCTTDAGTSVPACLLPPVDTSDAKDVSRLVTEVTWIERFAAERLGMRVDLSLLRHQSAVDVLLGGIGFSIALIIGALLATTGFALGFAALLRGSPPAISRCVAMLTTLGQTSPLPLLLFFGYVLAAGMLQYTASVALVTAVTVIGFYNGSNAGRAIHEAYLASRGRNRGSFLDTVSMAGVQLVAFLINAAKGSPAAGMIGVPEFLNVITDLTAYTRERVGVYLILLVFYTGLVLVVIAMLSVAETRLSAAMARSRC